MTKNTKHFFTHQYNQDICAINLGLHNWKLIPRTY